MIKIRPSLQHLMESCELEMQRKDCESYTIEGKDIEWLWDKLIEERKEVDECKENLGKFVNEEALHEVIMIALIRQEYTNNSWKEFIEATK